MLLWMAEKELVMDLSHPAPSAPLPQSAARVRPRNGLCVAALVLGVASLVAGVSFVLFPLALLGGLVGLIVGIVLSVDLSVRVGTWAARNSTEFARFDKCISVAANRADIATCVSRFANQVRP
jgi:hypothetical protein